MIVDRYRAVGLRANPFSTEAGAAAAAQVFVDRGLSAPPPPGSATLVQVLGDKGAGKTTHVQYWQQQVDGPYHYVPRAPLRDRFGRPPVAPIVYADEIDRLPAATRRAWFRASARVGATIVAGTHRDLSSAARRAGLHVITHRLGPADHSTLRHFVDVRVSAVATSSTGLELVDDRDLDEILVGSNGNLRSAEGMLHALFADRVRAIGEGVVAS